MNVMVITDRPEYGDQLKECLAIAQDDWGDLTFSFGSLDEGGEAAALADSLVFLIDPEKVGHAHWLRFLTGLKHRPAAILFWVNEQERLSAAERALVLSEVSLSVAKVTAAPKVWLGSTAVALLALRGPEVPTSESELQMALHRYRMGEQVSVPTAEGLLEFSGLNTFKENLFALRRTQQLLPGLGAGERIFLVVSTRPGTGKSTVARALTLAGSDWTVVERTVTAADLVRDELIRSADGVLFVTDAAWQDDLDAILPLLGTKNTWFLLNRADQFPTYGKLASHELRDCRQKAEAARVDRSRVIAGSGYLAMSALELASGQRKLEQVIDDPEVLLLDDWGLPLPKRAYRDRLSAWLEANHGLHDLINRLEGKSAC